MTDQWKLEQEIYEKLRAPFPLTCYSIDNSRGFELTSLKAQYIPIRLNEVLGLSGWSFTGEYKENEEGILFFGKLTVRIGEKEVVRESPGFHNSKKNEGDSYKGAKTDALSKAASYFGIAEQAFCGLISPDEVRKANSGKEPVAIPTFIKKKPQSESTNKKEQAWV